MLWPGDLKQHLLCRTDHFSSSPRTFSRQLHQFYIPKASNHPPPQRISLIFLFSSLTLQQLGVYEQLHDQQHHHEDDGCHQETVEARRQQADLPERRPSPTARLQPVRPALRGRWGWEVKGVATKINNVGSYFNVILENED